MSTLLTNFFSINGVIDTSRTALDNLNLLASSCNSWVTFDIHTGKWSVVVNEPGNSVASFNDSNIIGSITVSGSGITELYNKVQVEFSHKDLNDEKDTVAFEIPVGDKFAYETDNTLNFKFDCVNDPTQAEYLAAVQLKQSRVDKVIQFKTDYSMIGIKAGDVIDITSSMYGYTSKKFRVLTVAEEDADDFSMVISITAFEYSDDIYNTSGLVRTDRTYKNGVISKCVNQAIKDSEDDSFSDFLTRLLPLLVGAGALNSVFPKFWDWLYDLFQNPNIDVSGDTDACEGDEVVVSVQISLCDLNCGDRSCTLPYEITGVSASDIGVPLTGNVTVNTEGTASLTIPLSDDATFEGDETLTFTVDGQYSTTVLIHDYKSVVSVASPNTVAEGGSTTVTFTTVGIANGTSIPFTITGSGTGQVSNQPLTGGNVVINSNTATLLIQTTDLNTIGDTSISIALGGDEIYFCLNEPATITITGISVPGPIQNCEWVTIPVNWCGTFDNAGNALSIFPVGTMSVLKAISGQPSITVPLTVTVASNTITIATTVEIDASSAKGGKVAYVITSFDPITPGVKRVTGTTTQVFGY